MKVGAPITLKRNWAIQKFFLRFASDRVLPITQFMIYWLSQIDLVIKVAFSYEIYLSFMYSPSICIRKGIMHLLKFDTAEIDFWAACYISLLQNYISVWAHFPIVYLFGQIQESISLKHLKTQACSFAISAWLQKDKTLIVFSLSTVQSQKTQGFCVAAIWRKMVAFENLSTV